MYLYAIYVTFFYLKKRWENWRTLKSKNVFRILKKSLKRFNIHVQIVADVERVVGEDTGVCAVLGGAVGGW